MRAVFSLVLVLVLCVTSTCAYFIDRDSCKSDEQYNTVNDMVQQAFIKANLMLSFINEDPIQPDAKKLVKLLFNSTNDVQSRELVRRPLKPSENNKEKLGILTVEKEVKIEDAPDHDLSKLDKSEFAVFCDFSRLEKRSGEGNSGYFDRKLQVADGANPNIQCLTAFMYTTTNDEAPDSIQICPWFLEYAMAAKYKTLKDIRSFRGFLAALGLDRLMTSILYTPVDLLALWDRVMLHEMMHTKLTGTPSFDDVNGFRGYGWKNCKNMKPDDARKNADSWALFGHALSLMNEGTQISDDGKFTSPVTSSDSGKRWLGSGVSRGRDSVLVDAVKRFT